jgi:hypothetical protein
VLREKADHVLSKLSFYKGTPCTFELVKSKDSIQACTKSNCMGDDQWRSFFLCPGLVITMAAAPKMNFEVLGGKITIIFLISFYLAE